MTTSGPGVIDECGSPEENVVVLGVGGFEGFFGLKCCWNVENCGLLVFADEIESAEDSLCLNPA